ncbi:hypothetical protein [Halobacillus sp. H74]|uniref:hypothetical protein n=1 Tax=Halobacillus sp. H74 TaxID=3457436 RepID=UPI003FCC7874
MKKWYLIFMTCILFFVFYTSFNLRPPHQTTTVSTEGDPEVISIQTSMNKTYNLEPSLTCEENCTDLVRDLNKILENFSDYNSVEVQSTKGKIYVNQGVVPTESSGAVIQYASTTRQISLGNDKTLKVIGENGKKSKYIYYKREKKEAPYKIYTFTVVPTQL